MYSNQYYTELTVPVTILLTDCRDFGECLQKSIKHYVYLLNRKVTSITLNHFYKIF